MLKFLFGLLGLALCAWAFVDPAFRDAEGVLKGSFCLPLSAGIALVFLGWSMAKKWKMFGFWFALGLVGQAVALQMIDAGRLIHYQHYEPLGRLIETHPLLVIYFALQTALVLTGVKTRWRSIRTWLRSTFKPWQIAGVGLVFLLPSATVSRDVIQYIAELLFAAFVQTVNLGNIVLIASSLPEEARAGFNLRLNKWFGQPDDQDRASRIANRQSRIDNLKSKTRPERSPRIQNSTVDRFAILAAVWVIVLAAMLSVFSYQRHPHVLDEVIYLYHANYFAEGKLSVPAPPVPAAFSFYMIPFKSDRWYSIFPPGWPAMLTLGVLFGAPWLVNPVLAGLDVLLAFFLIREIYDRRTARLSVVLLGCSPWFIFMAMSFMSHTFTLTCALAGAVGVAWARKSGNWLWAWVGGGAVGVVGLIRPLDGVVMAGLLGLWAIGVGGQRLKVSAIAAFVLAVVAVSASVFPYNKILTGNPIASPLTAYYDEYYGPEANAFGFGRGRGLGWPIDPFPGHSPIEAVINADLNTFSLNVELFGWSTGSLLLVAVLLFSRALRKSDYLMLAVIAATVGAYSFYWFSGGPDFGARYWCLALIPLVALTARGIQVLEQTFNSNRSGAPVLIAVVSLCTFAFGNFFPWRAIDKYYHYLNMRPDIRDLAREYQFGKSLVLIRGDGQPDYASAWIYNSLNPRADGPLYAWDRNPEIRANVVKAYADRPVWLVDGPTLTHGPFKVVAGPLSGEALAAFDRAPRQP